MKRIRHAISACSTSKFAIVLCTIFLIFDFIAIFFLCDKIANIIIGITTGLIATISFYIFTRYTESIATIFEIQHLTTTIYRAFRELLKSTVVNNITIDFYNSNYYDNGNLYI